MGKDDTKRIADLEFENSVLQASISHEPEPQRHGEPCPVCKEDLIISRDPRVARCDNKDCKIQRVLI